MTSPSSSSYVFYHRTNPLRERKEGTLLTRVFITEQKITVYSKQIIKTAKSGVLFEKIIGQETFSVHKNHSGEEYLKRFSKSPTGSITDMSLEVALNIKGGDGNLIREFISEESKTLVEKTILEWFGYNRRDVEILEVQDRLLFPAFRDVTFPRDRKLAQTLADLQAGSSLVTKMLRESNSWKSFIINFCNPTISTMEDVWIVQAHPNELLPIAVMDLPSISTLYELNKEELLRVTATFQPLDLALLRFMFSNLSVENRFEAVQAVLGLARIHTERYQGSPSTRRYIYGKTEIAFKRVPTKLRPESAQKLFASLLKSYKVFQKAGSSIAFEDSYLCLELPHVFRYWFAQEVLEPQLKTATTVEHLESRFVELFGVPFSKDRSMIKFHTKKDMVFCSLHMLYAKPKISQHNADAFNYNTDLFTSLSALVVKKRPQDKGTGAGYSSALLNGYVGEDRSFVPVSGGLYSLDDIMSIIEAGAVETDKLLTKLGRKIIPENRKAFLTLGSKERKFKNTWKYYDWGVTDPAKILTLKASKVTRKEDVQIYNKLPEEMFNELLALHAGKEFNSIGY
jgi:hypothetical protein